MYGTVPMRFQYIERDIFNEFNDIYEDSDKKGSWKTGGAHVIADRWNTDIWPNIGYEDNNVVEYEKITPELVIEHYEIHKKTVRGAIKRKINQVDKFTDDLYYGGNLLEVDVKNKTREGEPVMVVNKNNFDAYCKGSY